MPRYTPRCRSAAWRTRNAGTSNAASAASRVSRGVTSSSTGPAGIVHGISPAPSMLRRRTSIGSKPSARATASIVPSITQLAIDIGARIGAEPHLLVSTTRMSQS